MKKLVLVPFLIILILICCVNEPNSLSFPGESPPEPDTDLVDFDDLVYRVCSPDLRVYCEQVEKLLVNSGTGNSESRTTDLGKWVFADYYTDNLDGIATNWVLGETTQNSWGAGLWGDGSPESGHRVVGDYALTVEFIIYVDALADSTPFHVYEFLPYGSDYTGKNIWLGDEHIFYFNPVERGLIATGAPYLEIFSDPDSGDILELRIEGTSYNKFQGIHAGNFDHLEDPGSTLMDMVNTFGKLEDVVELDSGEDIQWDRYNTFFNYPSSGDRRGGYIHWVYPEQNLNIRVFLTQLGDSEYHVTALYFLDFKNI